MLYTIICYLLLLAAALISLWAVNRRKAGDLWIATNSAPLFKPRGMRSTGAPLTARVLRITRSAWLVRPE